MNFTTKDIVEIMVILAAILGSWYNLRERVKVLETKVNPLYQRFIEGIKQPRARSHSVGGD